MIFNKNYNEESDKSFNTMKVLLKVLFIVSVAMFVIVGIICFKNYNDNQNLLNSIMLLIGFGCITIGPVISWLGYKVSMSLLWTAYDIKVIRDSVSNNYVEKKPDKESIVPEEVQISPKKNKELGSENNIITSLSNDEFTKTITQLATWKCKECGLINSKTSTHCVRCKANRN